MVERQGSVATFFRLEVVRKCDFSAYQRAGERTYASDFVVKTSLGVKLEAKMSQGEIRYTNGGIRCLVGCLVVDGVDVGLGVVFVDRKTETSYCCFCYP